MTTSIDEKTIATIRLLSVDAVAAANSGHPGAPLGLAPAAHVLWKKMRFNPLDPTWINRDRFILSNGHACALLYSLLCVYGYDLTTEDLSKFRSLHSKTPGHPENTEMAGIEVTTGPLGQGISNAVGLAIAQAQFGATYNKPGFAILDSHTYAFLGDGCLMEGVSSEASSLAGHLKLNNLIAFWDDNKISIDGHTDLAFTENVLDRYRAYGWHVIEVANGDSDLNAIGAAIDAAKKVTDKPTLIRLVTTIGFGSLIQGTHGVHGAPLKADDVAQLKKKWGFNPDEKFVVPQDVTAYLHEHVVENQKVHQEWNKTLEAYTQKFPAEGAEIQRRLAGQYPKDWEKVVPTFTALDPAVATRKLSEGVLAKLWDAIPELIGGLADLTPSNLTRTNDSIDFQANGSKYGSQAGRYIRYGVREHGMGAIMNGIAGFGGNFTPYGGTFLNFVSYAAGALRLLALSKLPVIWVATHDSIGLGEDGPTHQPIETLAHFRAIPNLMVWRPADGNETSAAYVKAVGLTSTPSVIALTRQNLPQLEGLSIEKASKGGYVLRDVAQPDIIIVATGLEVLLAVKAAEKLATENFKARVVSMPDCFTFDHQSEDYRMLVLPNGVPILLVEVMLTFGWSKYSHQHFGLDVFGASGKAEDIFKYFDFTVDGVASRAAKTIEFYKGKVVNSPLLRAF